MKSKVRDFIAHPLIFLKLKCLFLIIKKILQYAKAYIIKVI